MHQIPSKDRISEIFGTHQPRWKVLFTEAQQEESLARELSALDVGFYLPLARGDHLTTRFTNRSWQPLIPGLVFVNSSDCQTHALARSQRVRRILPVQDQVQLRADLLDLHQLLALECPLSVSHAAASPLRRGTGQSVRLHCLGVDVFLLTS